MVCCIFFSVLFYNGCTSFSSGSGKFTWTRARKSAAQWIIAGVSCSFFVLCGCIYVYRGRTDKVLPEGVVKRYYRIFNFVLFVVVSRDIYTYSTSKNF